tara:strand:+ start:88749 stop:89090 length:342 start_codon:yes stop_codon:yes gene_type:complete
MDTIDLAREELIYRIFSKLKDYSADRFPLRRLPLTRLEDDNLSELYRFVMADPDSPVEGLIRPSTPLTIMRGGKEYKQAMADYIGLEFELLDTPLSLLEALANYMERNQKNGR